MSKHDLRARPVFHHTHDAIEAHLTVVMATLAVARYLQDVTGISIKRIIRTLKTLQDVTINLNGHNITAQPQITPTAASILKSLQSPGQESVAHPLSALHFGCGCIIKRFLPCWWPH